MQAQKSMYSRWRGIDLGGVLPAKLWLEVAWMARSNFNGEAGALCGKFADQAEVRGARRARCRVGPRRGVTTPERGRHSASEGDELSARRASRCCGDLGLAAVSPLVRGRWLPLGRQR